MSVLERVREAEEASGAGSDLDERMRKERMASLRADLKRDLMGRLGLDMVASMLADGSVERAREEVGVTLRSILNAA